MSGRSVKWLESFRSGRAGLALFYGYLIAILVAFVVLVHVTVVNSEQNDAITGQQHRQCLAIKGATTYWTNVREAVKLRLSDFTRSPIEKRADETTLAALNDVIGAGTPLSCDE